MWSTPPLRARLARWAAAAAVLLVACVAYSAEIPDLVIRFPQPGQHIAQFSTVQIVVDADEMAVARTITFSVDGYVRPVPPPAGPQRRFLIPWEVGDTAPGPHQLRVTVVAGRVTKWVSDTVQVYVDRGLPTPRTHSYALLVGVGEYDDAGIPKLPSTARDVQAVYAALVDRRWGAYPPQNVHVLCSGVPKIQPPTGHNVRYELKYWLAQKAKHADSVLLFFSGHGFNEKGRDFLVPSDARLGEMQATSLSLASVQEILAGTGAHTQLLLVDACRNSLGKASLQMAPTASVRPGQMTLFSCGRDQKSWEWEQQGQSIFSYSLAEALLGAADQNSDGSVSVVEMVTYVHDRVSQWAHAQRHDQDPLLVGRPPKDCVVSGLARRAYAIPAPARPPASNHSPSAIKAPSRPGDDPGAIKAPGRPAGGRRTTPRRRP